MGPEGFAHPPESPANAAEGQLRSAKSGAPAADFDIELRLIVDGWHAMPEPVRAEIVQIVRRFIEQPNADAQQQRIEAALAQANAIDRALDKMLTPEPV